MTEREETEKETRERILNTFIAIQAIGNTRQCKK